MRFKQFISEAAADKHKLPFIDPLSVEKGMELLNTHCKDALWMLEKNEFLYRGESHHGTVSAFNTTGFSVVDTAATERKSQNTSNFYTQIFDHHPEMIKMGFPKRSRSFICSTDYNRANDFIPNNYKDFWRNIMVLVPFDGTPIGFTNKSDIWNIQINLFGKKRDLEEQNFFLRHLKIKDTWEALVEFGKKYDAKNPKTIETFNTAFPNALTFDKLSFIDQVLAAYAPEKTGMTAGTTANWTGKRPSSECWVGGKCVLLTLEMKAKICKEYLKQKRK